VIFYSDNGGLASYYPGAATSEAPLRAGKGWLYEGGIRVPLIVRWPGKIPANSENASLVSSPDFYPTLLEMAGVKSESTQDIEGVSFWSALSEGKELTDRTLYWHWPHYSNHGQQSPGGAIREGDYKLIEYYENNTRQLFNLREDMEEMNDLVEQEPETAERLTKKLHEWRERIDAQMPVPNPDYTG
jgi:arylsulfatase A-like enzyme